MITIPQFSVAAALGRCENDLERVEGTIALHRDVIKPWQQLVAAAQEHGFSLSLASGYRSFDRQCMIWNAKLSGERPVLNDDGCEVELKCLLPLERVQCVMRWSALPGTSRHHWGADMDIYDKSAVPVDYQLQLTPEEYSGNGPFAPMIQWLEDYLASGSTPEFFFPYRKDLGGVHPEPWHLSYRPVAEQFQSIWSLQALVSLLAQSELEEKETVIKQIESLYERYIVHSINPELAV